MSSITFADNKTGGRFTAAADAIAAGHLNRAAGILAELADELNVEATEAGLLAEEVEVPPREAAEAKTKAAVDAMVPQLSVSAQPADLQMCGRGVHSFGESDPISGWRTCQTCGQVNVAPPENNGAIDMSARQ